jgi:hypothetical protein
MSNPLNKNFLESYEWFDVDLAVYDIGVALGLCKWDNFSTTSKWIVWSNNLTGNMLGKILQELIQLGYVELNEDNQVRRIKDWKPK